MNLLFSEHAYVIAKAGDAAAGGRTDEYTAYATQLTKNSDDMQNLINSAAGASGSNAFGNIWNQYLGFVAAYTVGVVTHDDAKTAAAASSLTNQFTPSLAQFLADTQGGSQIDLTPTVVRLVQRVRAVLDDEASSAWTKLFIDIGAAAGAASQIGDQLGAKFIRAYPDRFPGTAAGTAFNLRLALNLDLQQMAYLGTMATEAVIGARADESTGATNQLTSTVQALSKDLARSKTETWNSWTTDLTSYAAKTQAGDLQQAQDQITNDGAALGLLYMEVDPAGVVRDAVATQTQDEVAVVDAQRQKDVNAAATRDRAAASAMEPIADSIAGFVVKANPNAYKA
jgi:hypothetical protein